MRKCDRFTVVSDFRSLMAEIYFLSMETSQNKSGATIQFLVGGLVVHFAGISHLCCSVQKLFKNFMLLQQLRNFSFLGGKY
jgi:hypothetical protein